MMKILILLFIFKGCTLLETSSFERKRKSKIISQLSSKRIDYLDCAKENELFKELGTKRVRMTLYLTVDSKGHIDSFQADTKAYPENFLNCVFTITDLIPFSKSTNPNNITIEQVFTLSQR